MLEHLFGSKTRVKLLRLFLRNPDEPIFVRELTRRVETQINAVRRELLNLVKLGLVTEAAVEEPATTPTGKKRPGLKRKYYQLNKQFPLLNELSSLILKAQVLLDRRLDKEIAALGDVRYLAFMGAFIQGTGGTSNGPAIDLFLVGKIDMVGFKTLMTEVEGVFGSELNFSILAPDEFRYRKELGDRFLHSILDAPKKVLIDRLHER